MKRIVALVLTALMLLSLCAFSEPITGGWSISMDATVTDELKSLFDKALDGLLGVNYEPIAYLGSQTVAGTNHCFLCRATVVYPGAEPAYKLVYIYEAIGGDTEITAITDLDIAALSEAGME